MAALFHTTLTSGPVSATSRVLLHTGTAGAVLLVWKWGNEAVSLSAVAAAGSPLTRLGAVSAGTSRMELWGLTGVPTGVLTISAAVVGTNAQAFGLIAQTFTGVRRPNPFGTVAAGTVAAATVANLSVSATTSSIVAFAFGISANTTLTLGNGTLNATATHSTLGRMVVGNIAGNTTVSVSCSAGASGQWAFMGVPLFDAPSMSTVREDFNTAMDAVKWFTDEPPATPTASDVTFDGGEVVLRPAESNTWASILYMGSTPGFYKIDGDGIYAKCTSRLKTTNTVAGGYTIFSVYENDDLNRAFGFWVGTDNVLKASVFNAGVTATATTLTTTWDSDNTPWLRLAYSASTSTAKWYTAPDDNGNPGTWTLRTAMATTAWFVPNLSKVYFLAGNDNWAATGATTSPAKFDNFNDTRRNVSIGPTDAPDIFSASATVVPAGDGGITAYLSATDAQDIFAASAQVRITGRLSATDALDTFASTAQVRITSRLSATDATDTFVSSAQARITARLSATDAADIFASSAQVRITSRLSATDAADTFASSAQVRITATLAATDAPDTFSASSNVIIQARLSATDAQDIFAASIQTQEGLATRSAIAAFTDNPDAFSATGYAVIAATLAATDTRDTFAATASVVIQSRLSATDAADTFLATVTTVASVSAAPAPARIDSGAGHGKRENDYIPANESFWEAREKYLLSLRPEIEVEPGPEIFPEPIGTVEPAPVPKMLGYLRIERREALDSISTARNMRQLRSAGKRLRLTNQRIVALKQELSTAHRDAFVIQAELLRRRDTRNRKIARMRKQLALLETARQLLHLQDHM